MSNNYWLDMAEEYARTSTCLRRKYGSVLVKHNQRVSYGTNNAPVGRKTCKDLGYCVRMKYNIPRGTRYELCRSIHSELDAIIKSSQTQLDIRDSVLYLVGIEIDGSYVKNSEPCIMCKKAIINAGISEVVIRDTKESFRVINVQDWVNNDQTENCEDSYIENKE